MVLCALCVCASVRMKRQGLEASIETKGRRRAPKAKAGCRRRKEGTQEQSLRNPLSCLSLAGWFLYSASEPASLAPYGHERQPASQPARVESPTVGSRQQASDASHTRASDETTGDPCSCQHIISCLLPLVRDPSICAYCPYPTPSRLVTSQSTRSAKTQQEPAMSEKEPTTKPSDLGLADEPEPPAVSHSDAPSQPPSSVSDPSDPYDPSDPSNSSQPTSTSAPSQPPSSAPIDVDEAEEETTPTATNPTPPTAASAASDLPVPSVDISEPEDPEAKRGEVKASFRSASWKSVTPEFTAPLPYQSMIIVEEFEVEGAAWSGKAWQMVTT